LVSSPIPYDSDKGKNHQQINLNLLRPIV